MHSNTKGRMKQRDMYALVYGLVMSKCMHRFWDFETYGLISSPTVWFRVLQYRFRVLQYRFRVLRSNFETYGLSSRPRYIFLNRRSRIRDLRCHFEVLARLAAHISSGPQRLAMHCHMACVSCSTTRLNRMIILCDDNIILPCDDK